MMYENKLMAMAGIKIENTIPGMLKTVADAGEINTDSHFIIVLPLSPKKLRF